MIKETGHPYNDKQSRVYKNEAERGCIYRFVERDNSPRGNYALVVSSMKRRTDKMISVLMLGDSKAGADVITINFPDGEEFVTKSIHCGMVTYTGRDRLRDKVYALPEDCMAKVDFGIMTSLGLTDTVDYKTLYENLLDKVCKGEGV